MGERFKKFISIINNIDVPKIPLSPPLMMRSKEAFMNMTPNKCGDCKWFHTLFEKLKDIGECYYYPPTQEGSVKISKERDACSKFSRKGVWEN